MKNERQKPPNQTKILRNLLARLFTLLLIAGFAFGQTQDDKRLELIVETGHPMGVTSLAFSPDGKLVASGGLNGAVKLWNVETGKELRTLNGHYREVESIVFSPDGKMIASIEARDNKLILWDVQTGADKWEAYIGIGSFSFSPDSGFLVSEYRLWDVESGKVPEFLGEFEILGDQPQMGPIAMSPDGKTLAIGNQDSGIRLWNLATEKELGSLKGHTGQISSLAFSPDGKTLASSGEDNKVVFWDVESGSRIGNPLDTTEPVYSLSFSPDGKFIVIGAEVWNVETRSKPEFLEEQINISELAFSLDGRLIALKGDDNKITLWDLATGRRKGKAFESNEIIGVGPFAFSPDGRLLKDGGEVWDVETWSRAKFLGEQGEFDAIAFSPDGKLMALHRHVDLPPRAVAMSPDTPDVELWDLAAKKGLRHFESHSAYVGTIYFSPDGRILASGDRNGSVRLWDLKTARELNVLEGDGDFIGSIAFSSDLKTLASHQMARIGYTVKLWDLETGKSFRTIESVGSAGDLSFSPDGRFLIYGSSVWDAKTGVKPDFFDRVKSVDWITFSTDGKSLAAIETSSEDDGRHLLNVWDMATGARRQLQDPEEFFSGPFAFSPNGKYIAASGSGYPYLIVWDVGTGNVIQVIEDDFDRLKAWPPESILFSPDSRVVSADRGDNLPVGIWEIATGGAIKYDRLPEWVHLSGSFAVTSVNGKMIRAESDGAQIDLTDADNGKVLASIMTLDEKDWAVISPDGRFDASDGAMNLMHYSYGLETIDLRQFKREYYEPGLLQKVLGFNKEALRAIVPLKDVKLPPDVVEQSIEPDSNVLTIKLKSRGGGIGKTEVYVNNSLSIPDARTERLKADPFVPENEIVTLTVDLTGSKFIYGKICELIEGKEVCRSEDVIEVVTSNHLKEIGKGNVQGRGSQSVRTAEGREKYTLPSLYAVVAGVSDYGPNVGSGIKDPLDLSFAAKDAEDFSNALSLGARRLFCPKENLNCLDKVQIKTLSTNRKAQAEQPTKENIRKSIAEIAQKARPEDIVVIYLSGHGVSFATGTDTYFYLTKDASSAGKEDLAKNFQDVAVSNDELAEWLTQTEWNPGEKGIKALNQVLILDTCAAGNFAGKDGWKTDKDLSADQIRAIEFLRDKSGTFILMGSSANKPSYEANSFGQGLLTYALLEGMKGAALQPATNNVDVKILFEHTEKRVPALAKEINIIQQPRIFLSGNNFIIGQMTGADREKITLPKSKPMMLPPRLTDPETGDDDEGLIRKLGKLLEAESSYTVVRERGGKETPLVYVNSESFPGAVRVTGTYTVEGDNIRIVKAFLRKDNVTIATLAENLVSKKEEIAGELLKLVRSKLAELP